MGNIFSKKRKKYIPKLYLPKNTKLTDDDIESLVKSWKFCVRTLSSAEIKKGGTMYHRINDRFLQSLQRYDLPSDLISHMVISITKKTIHRKQFPILCPEIWEIIGFQFLKTLQWAYRPKQLDFQKWLKGLSWLFHSII